MRQLAVVAFACGLLVGVNGCGNIKGEAETKELIKLMNARAEALEKKEVAHVEELEKQAEEAKKRLDELKMTDEEKQKLKVKYRDDVQKAAKRIEDAKSPKGSKS